MLSEQDKVKIQNYIRYYASSGYDVCGDSAPLDYILRIWESNKRHFYKLFGDKLIVEVPVQYEISKDTLMYELQNRFKYEETGPICDRLTDKIHAYNSSIPYWRISDLVQSLFGHFNLANNEVRHLAFHLKESYLNTPEGKRLAVPETVKPFRFLRKLIEKFGASEFDKEQIEKFRITHSMVLEKKEIKGTLCLSVHPLDYMTMSDNAANWQTCMNWTDDDGAGEYKQGTVEMMNSDCVIVGYLKSEDTKFKFGGEPEDEWNNKLWRQLFIVKPDYILSVKPYPYENYPLTQAAVGAIRDLLGWDSSTPIDEFTAGSDCQNETSDGKHTVSLQISAGAMYNDFNRCKHFICVRPGAPAVIDEDLYYSGPSECMCCGMIDEGSRWWQERMLLCKDCINVYVCEHCGCVLWEDEIYDFDGHAFCGDCYYEETIEDDITGERIWYDDDVKTIQFSTSNEGFQRDRWSREVHTAKPFDTITEYFTKVNIHPGQWEVEYYVCPKDLTEKGMMIMGFSNEETMQKYIDKQVKPIGTISSLEDFITTASSEGYITLPF